MRLPSRLCALLLAEALAVPGLSAQPPRATFDELWQWEQGVRNAANALKADPAPARAQLDSAVASLERLITWCRSSVARRARNENGQPLLVWQEGDILLDLVGLHARRGDATAAIDAVRRAGAFLAGPDSPIAAGVADDGLFTTLADVVVEDRSSALWRDVPEGVRVLDSLRVRDAARQLRALPFSLAYADTLPLADRIAGLSYLWSEAKYNFVHFDLVPSLDWSAAYREALPRVVAAPRTIDYYRVLQAFLARLHDGHTDVQLPSPLVAHHAIRPRLLTERIEGRVVVRLVGHARMDSLGVRVGQELTHVDGIPVERYAEEQVAPYVSASTVHDREDRVFGRVLLAGAQGRSVRLTLVDADGTVRTVDAPRDTALAWRRVPPFSLTMRPDSIAVVSLTTFADASVVGEFERVLPSLSRARGLIIDIRENDGGNSRHGWDILARLIGQPSRTASWSTPQYRPAFRSWGRSSGTYREEGARVIPRAPHFPGPVAVLIGRRTFSAAEDFAVAFDVARRGPLIGEPTGGSTGNPISLRLPGGGHARICAKDDRYPDGRTFVGVGVQPTIAVVRTIADLRAGRDATLERAVEALTRPRVRTPVRGARGARAAATMSASR